MKTKLKYLKTFELYSSPNPGTGNQIDYEVGDTVVCSDDIGHSGAARGNKLVDLNKNTQYKVLKLYKTIEDKFLGNKFLRVDVQNLETGEITKGWESTRFKLEFEFDADKYNL